MTNPLDIRAGRGPLWPALTYSLKDASSPVTRFLAERVTNLSEVQRQYRDSVGPLQVDLDRSLNPGTLGTATDWLLRFLLYPTPDLHLAAYAGRAVPVFADGLADLAGLLQCRNPYHDVDADLEPTFDGPCLGSQVDVTVLARASWALALLTEIYRAGPRVMERSPLRPLSRARSLRAEDLLELAPPVAVDQLLELRAITVEVLMPALAARRGSWAIGPTFTGSALMNADADFIAAGMLVELKTEIGRKVGGSRRLGLEKSTLLQLLGYVLLDFDDEYGLTEVAVFNPRFAHLVTWELRGLLGELAGRAVDLARERAAFQTLLRAGPGVP